MQYTATIDRLQSAATNGRYMDGIKIVKVATLNHSPCQQVHVYRRACAGASRAALNMLLHHTRRHEEARIDNIIRDFYPKPSSD